MPNTSSKYALEFRTWLHVILTQNVAPFPGMPWQMHHSTKSLFSPANWI